MTDWEVWHPAQQPAEANPATDATENPAFSAATSAEAANDNGAFEADKPQSASSQTDDLRDLHLAIEIYPDVPANYLLRGELYAKRREWVLAEEDFKMALQLASDQLEKSNWGLAEQMVMDSAQRALEQLKNNW